MTFLDSIIWFKWFMMLKYSLLVYPPPPPSGFLHVQKRMWMYCIIKLKKNSAAKVASKLAYDNYIGDRQAWETYGSSYEVYLVNIIDELILRQDQLLASRLIDYKQCQPSVSVDRQLVILTICLLTRDIIIRTSP